MTHLGEDALLDLVHGMVPADEAEGMLGHLQVCSGCEARFFLVARDDEKARVAPLRIPPAQPGAQRWKTCIVSAAILACVLLELMLRDRPAAAPYWLPV